MHQRELVLALKKQHLLLRSAALREQMAADAGGLAPAFAVATRARDALAWLRARPLVPIAAGIGLAIVRPRRAFLWARRILSVWLVTRRLSARFLH